MQQRNTHYDLDFPELIKPFAGLEENYYWPITEKFFAKNKPDSVAIFIKIYQKRIPIIIINYHFFEIIENLPESGALFATPCYLVSYGNSP